MMSKVKNFIKNNWFCILLTCIMAVSIGLLIHTHQKDLKLKERLDEIEIINKDNSYRKIYYEKEISSLKKTNKELYDSIKGYKDQVSYLIQFKYEKEYDTGQVNTKPKTDADNQEKDTASAERPEIKEYAYKNEINDTMNYNLTIASEKEPEWYRLKVKLSDKFTIINKDKGDINDITIGGEHQGNISDVTVFTRKEKESFLDRIAIGPSVGYTYDFQNKTFGATIGFSITYNLFSKHKLEKCSQK